MFNELQLLKNSA